jgi:hypothetical protein
VSTLGWIAIGVAIAVVVAVAYLLWQPWRGGWTTLAGGDRATRVVATLLLAAALVAGTGLVVYGVLALKESSPNKAPSTATTERTVETITEAQTAAQTTPKTTRTEKTVEKTEPASADTQIGLLGALLAFTFGVAAIGGVLLTRQSAGGAAEDPAPDQRGELITASLEGAIRSAEAAMEASNPSGAVASRIIAARIAGEAAIDVGQLATASAQQDLPGSAAVQTCLVAAQALNAGRTAIENSEQAAGDPGADLDPVAGAAQQAAAQARLAAESAAALADPEPAPAADGAANA